MQQPVYHSRDVQAWEQRWFSQQNSDYGLMQQAAWAISQRLISLFDQKKMLSTRIAVCCGAGNNAGDGYLVAKYLHLAGYSVDVYSTELGESTSLIQAYYETESLSLNIYEAFDFHRDYDVYIDALFGIGLNRSLNTDWQAIIESINLQTGLKISIDIPSGLHADTGQVLPCAIKADYTYTILGLKAGLFTGKGKEYAGQIELVSLIPVDDELQPLAYLSPKNIQLPEREAFGHKGSYGHVLIVGGHADMGGAVIMAAESAFSAGAGKVSIVCDAKHHTAILARSPNIMVRDINDLDQQVMQQLIDQIDAVSFGMGLGRDAWSEQQFLNWFPILNQSEVELVLDADALWFLANHPTKLKVKCYATPHPGEAAKLLDKKTSDIEANRIQAIHDLQQRYTGEWVLKGAGSLILQDKLWICTAGNAGMATGGMGDVLAGMVASLKAQFHQQIQLYQIVTLHALAGDHLASLGMRGVQAHHMSEAVYEVVNHSIDRE